MTAQAQRAHQRRVASVPTAATPTMNLEYGGAAGEHQGRRALVAARGSDGDDCRHDEAAGGAEGSRAPPRSSWRMALPASISDGGYRLSSSSY